MRWVVAHDGWDWSCGFYRTYYIRPGYFSNDINEAKKLSWIGAKLLAKKYATSATDTSDKYFVIRG